MFGEIATSHSNLTNAERIASHIAAFGADGILIHSVPRTPFWLVCQKRALDDWTISLVHPLQTKRHLLSQHVSDDEHATLYQELIGLEVSARIKDALKVYSSRIANAHV